MAVDNKIITLRESQATNGYNSDGQAVGIPTYDEGNNLTRYRINPETNEIYDAGTTGEVEPKMPAAQIPKVSVGAGANDDAGSNPTKIVPSKQTPNSRIEPQPNILDQYASYIYSLSWFLLSPKSMALSRGTSGAQYKNRLLQNAQLLVRSGGLPREIIQTQNSLSGSTKTQPSSLYTVSPEFDLDFYIDDLEISSKFWGKGTTAPHNVTNLKFLVTEPYGITLVPRIFRATQSFYEKLNIAKENKTINYTSAQYAIVISFYGYDDSGNLVKAQNNNINRSLSNYQIIDSLAVVEKVYPFQITGIEFKVANKVTEYTISGKPLVYNINAAQARNTIPFPVNLTGSTLQEVLNGKISTPTSNVSVDGRTNTQTPTNSYWSDVN